MFLSLISLKVQNLNSGGLSYIVTRELKLTGDSTGSFVLCLIKLHVLWLASRQQADMMMILLVYMQIQSQTFLIREVIWWKIGFFR